MKYLDERSSNVFRKNFRIYSVDKGIMVKDVAEKLDMKNNTLSMILIGQRHKHLELDLAEKIAGILGVEFEHLIVGQILYVNPEIKKFLQVDENQELIIDYIKKQKQSDKIK